MKMMAKYTTEIRSIVESLGGENEPHGYGDVGEIIQAAIPKIFNFDFPIWDEGYRNVLCTKILMHFYTREIGMETYGLWKLRLNTKLNEIMPYYNTLYANGLAKLNIFNDTELVTEYKGEGTGKEDTSGTSEEGETIKEEIGKKRTEVKEDNAETTDTRKQTGKATTNETSETKKQTGSTDLFSETPQGGLDGLISSDYLTNARKIDGTEIDNGTVGVVGSTEQESEGSVTFGDKIETTGSENEDREVGRAKERKDNGSKDSKSTEEYIMSVKGRQGTNMGELMRNLAAMRDTLLNVDMMIIKELEPLFMCLW